MTNEDGLGALASSVHLVVGQWLDDTRATLTALCAARDIRFPDLTSKQLEEVLGDIANAVARVAGDDAATMARADLRLLLDTDRYRRGVVVPQETSLLLLVDDDLDVRESFAGLLRDEGYRVEVASHGKEAWDKLKAGAAPRVILLDLMMPVMNGWELWDRLQTSPRLRDTPVIVVTATGLGQGSFGKTLVLKKPVSRGALLGAIALSVKPVP